MPIPSRLCMVTTMVLLALPACGGDDDGNNPPDDPIKPTPVDYIDLTADTNRDGLVDDTDNAGEDLWSVDSGAAFLPNLDDDDLNGLRDAEDPAVGNEADGLDLVPIFVKAWDKVPSDATGLITLDPWAVPHVRIFAYHPESGFYLLAGANSCDGQAACDPATINLTSVDIQQGVELRIEGVHLPGTPEAVGADGVPWGGLVELRYAILDASGVPITMEANPAGLDILQLHIAPWVMFGNSTPNLNVIFANDVMPAFIAGISAATNDEGIEFHVIDNWGDHWTEDYFQTGFASVAAPDGQVHGIRLAMPRPWGRTNADSGLPVHFLETLTAEGKDQGHFVVYKQPHTGDSYDSHGNHDLIPAYSHNGQDFPYGRIIYGSGVLQETKDFYEMQLVQAPALTVNTSFLTVGHVDEIFSYVPAATPRGWKLMVASPSLARSMMETWQSQGHGAVEMFVGKQWSNNAQAAISIDEALADTGLMAQSQQAQAAIDAALDIMIAEIGLTPDEIIEIPSLFENDFGLVAYNPGTVNSLVFGERIVIPDPFGPNINGVDGFKQDLIDRLATPVNALGSEGQGLQVYFADDWNWYHRLLGEVHCGTNMWGPPQPEIKWWEAMQ